MDKKFREYFTMSGVANKEQFAEKYGKGFELYYIADYDGKDITNADLLEADTKSIAIMTNISRDSFTSPVFAFGEVERMEMTEEGAKAKQIREEYFRSRGFENVVHSAWIRYPKKVENNEAKANQLNEKIEMLGLAGNTDFAILASIKHGQRRFLAKTSQAGFYYWTTNLLDAERLSGQTSGDYILDHLKIVKPELFEKNMQVMLLKAQHSFVDCIDVPNPSDLTVEQKRQKIDETIAQLEKEKEALC